MRPSLENLLKTIFERHGKLVLTPENAREKDVCERSFGTVSELLHLVSLDCLVAFLDRRVFSREIAELSTAFLYDPSVVNMTRFQTQLFSRYRTIFGQIFPLRFPGKDLIPLYLKKYLQILDEFHQLSQAEKDKRSSPEAEKVFFEALTFFANNYNTSVALLKPSQNVPDGPEVVAISQGGLPMQKVRSISHQVKEGLYFIPEIGQPLCLDPFFHSENGHHFVLRMLTREGAFYRCLDEEGYRLFLSPPLLVDFGEVLFRLGAFERALAFYRMGGSQNREVLIIASALSHCINSIELSRQGEHLQAAAELELALAVKPDLPVLYHELSSAYQKGNSLQQAAAVLNRLLERFPLSDEGYIALGDIFAAKGDWPRANRAYDKTLTINPFHPAVAQRKNFLKGKLDQKAQEAAKSEGGVEDFLENLTDRVRERRREQLYGRGEELKNLLEILTCRDKKNALVVGEAGVGKTSLVEELVAKTLTDEVPSGLKGKRFFLLNAGSLIAGARFRGQFEERVLEVIKKVKDQGDVLVVENIHQLVGTSGSRGSSLDSSSIIKPFLSKGDLVIVGTTDPESFAQIKEKDPSFLKFFHPITLEELPGDIIHQVILERKKNYEEFHGVSVPQGVFENALELVKISMNDRALPESVLDLMDRTCASVAISAAVGGAPTIVTREAMLQTLSEMSGISYERLSRLTPERLSTLEQLLSQHVIGQEEAISKVSRVVRACKLGFDLYPYRPDGVLMFVGPTGVGKTELAKTLAKVLFGDEDKLIRIDMSEYMERISTSRLIGTSPGYVGYYDPNQLTDKIRKNPYSVMLFDEIEKADPQVLNLFLQIFDAGRLTDGRGRTVRFNHATVIMTSNLGTEVFTRGKVGFKNRDDGGEERAHVMREIRKYFAPEFLNRIDEIVVFDPLSEEDVVRIMDLELCGLRERMLQEGKTLVLTDRAKSHIAKKGYSYEYGARNLARVLRREIAEPLAAKALEPLWEEKEVVLVDCRDGAMTMRLLDREGAGGDMEDQLALSAGEDESDRADA